MKPVIEVFEREVSEAFARRIDYLPTDEVRGLKIEANEAIERTKRLADAVERCTRLTPICAHQDMMDAMNNLTMEYAAFNAAQGEE